jgi:hypothetical protein
MALERRARIAAAPCRGTAMPVSDGARASSEPRVRSSSSTASCRSRRTAPRPDCQYRPFL